MTAALSKRVLDEYAAVRDSLPAGVISPERRQEAIQALAARGLPTTREENWRYTNLRPLERARFAPAAGSRAAAATTATSAAAPPLPSASDLPPELAGFARYAFVDGTFAPELSSAQEQAGLTVRSLRGGTQGAAGHASSATVLRASRALSASGNLPETRLALLNDAFATDSAAIHVSGAAAEPARVELLFVAVAGADTGASYPRVSIGLDPASRLILVERHIGAGGGTSFVNSSVSVDVGRGAHL